MCVLPMLKNEENNETEAIDLMARPQISGIIQSHDNDSSKSANLCSKPRITQLNDVYLYQKLTHDWEWISSVF